MSAFNGPSTRCWRACATASVEMTLLVADDGPGILPGIDGQGVAFRAALPMVA
jgi:hypothetical protein